MKIAAIYARVSGERQRDDNTIASQTEALIAYAEDHGYSVAPDMITEDDGYTGTVLERPGLERVRDLTAEGRIDTVLVHAPDRLSRRYAYQVLIIEELARQGVETVLRDNPVRLTISRMAIPSLKCQRRITLNNAMSITPLSPAKSMAGQG